MLVGFSEDRTGALAGSIGSEMSCGEDGFLADAFGGGGGADGRLAMRGIPVDDTARAGAALTVSGFAATGALIVDFLTAMALGAGVVFLVGRLTLTAIFSAGLIGLDWAFFASA